MPRLPGVSPEKMLCQEITTVYPSPSHHQSQDKASLIGELWGSYASDLLMLSDVWTEEMFTLPVST